MVSQAKTIREPFRHATEREFTTTVEHLARVHGWLLYHTWVSIHSAKGFPDLVLVKPPRLVVVELKSDRGKVSDDQSRWLNALAECPGVETYVWRPADWDEIVAVLGRKGNG